MIDRMLASRQAQHGTASVNTPKYVLAAAFPVLIPFVYSFDNDPYRAWEVVAIAIVSVFMVGLLAFRARVQLEHVVLLAYCFLLVVQPLYIPSFTLWFGFQYAVVMLAAFVPAWAMNGVKWRPKDFESGVHLGIRVATVIIVVNIVGGRLLSFGENFQTELTGSGRSFGFLGDSISPAIIFPLIYFAAQRKLIWAGALAVSLAMTGGKAALVMAALALPLLAITRRSRFVQTASILALFIVGFLVYPILSSFLAEFMQNDVVAYSWNNREISYQVGWQYFVDHPWLGVGINQSMHNIKLDADEMAYFNGVIRYFPVYQIHNAYVRALAETGVFGFAILAVFSLVWILRSLRSLHLLHTRGAGVSTRLRAIVLTSSLWPILFIATYQTTGWFEHGHPQFAWLLIINAIGVVSTRLLEILRSTSLPQTYQRSAPAPPRINSAIGGRAW